MLRKNLMIVAIIALAFAAVHGQAKKKRQAKAADNSATSQTTDDSADKNVNEGKNSSKVRRGGAVQSTEDPKKTKGRAKGAGQSKQTELIGFDDDASRSWQYRRRKTRRRQKERRSFPNRRHS